jgi:hypothetical protein
MLQQTIPTQLMHCQHFSVQYKQLLGITTATPTPYNIFNIFTGIYIANGGATTSTRFNSIIDNLVDMYRNNHVVGSITPAEFVEDVSGVILGIKKYIEDLHDDPSSIWNALAKSTGTKISEVFNNISMPGYRKTVESAKFGSCKATQQCAKTVGGYNNSTKCKYCGITSSGVRFECEHLLECNLLAMLIGLAPGDSSSQTSDVRTKALQYLINAEAYQWSCRRCNQIKSQIQGDNHAIVSSAHGDDKCTILVGYNETTRKFEVNNEVLEIYAGEIIDLQKTREFATPDETKAYFKYIAKDLLGYSMSITPTIINNTIAGSGLTTQSTHGAKIPAGKAIIRGKVLAPLNILVGKLNQILYQWSYNTTPTPTQLQIGFENYLVFGLIKYFILYLVNSECIVPGKLAAGHTSIFRGGSISNLTLTNDNEFTLFLNYTEDATQHVNRMPVQVNLNMDTNQYYIDVSSIAGIVIDIKVSFYGMHISNNPDSSISVKFIYKAEHNGRICFFTQPGLLGSNTFFFNNIISIPYESTNNQNQLMIENVSLLTSDLDGIKEISKDLSYPITISSNTTQSGITFLFTINVRGILINLDIPFKIYLHSWSTNPPIYSVFDINGEKLLFSQNGAPFNDNALDFYKIVGTPIPTDLTIPVPRTLSYTFGKLVGGQIIHYVIDYDPAQTVINVRGDEYSVSIYTITPDNIVIYSIFDTDGNKVIFRISDERERERDKSYVAAAITGMVGEYINNENEDIKNPFENNICTLCPFNINEGVVTPNTLKRDKNRWGKKRSSSDKKGLNLPLGVKNKKDTDPMDLLRESATGSIKRPKNTFAVKSKKGGNSKKKGKLNKSKRSAKKRKTKTTKRINKKRRTKRNRN